jgi:hypothetical protein
MAFLRDFALAAGFAGDSVTTSSMTVNGFSMQCVDFRAPGVQGTSTICTTAQGILGYVKVAPNPASFEITAYSTSPPASLFRLPPGAKITTLKTGTKWAAARDHDLVVKALTAMVRDHPAYGRWARIRVGRDATADAADVAAELSRGRVLVRVKLPPEDAIAD